MNQKYISKRISSGGVCTPHDDQRGHPFGILLVHPGAKPRGIALNKKILLFAISSVALLSAQTALAVCPVCTVAVGAGIGLSRWLNIDDSITGLWLGGFLLSISLWTVDWLDRKKIRFFLKRFFVILAYYAFAIVPLYYAKIIASPFAFICSCASDKLLLGTIEGTAVFFFAVKLYEFLKQRNNNHSHFPYEKIVFPVALLAVFTIIFYLLTK